MIQIQSWYYYRNPYTKEIKKVWRISAKSGIPNTKGKIEVIDENNYMYSVNKSHLKTALQYWVSLLIP